MATPSPAYPTITYRLPVRKKNGFSLLQSPAFFFILGIMLAIAVWQSAQIQQLSTLTATLAEEAAQVQLESETLRSHYEHLFFRL